MAELPFVEKWRPVSLEDLVGDTSVEKLKAFVKSGSFPLAMVFHGEFGTGKTTAAKAMVRDYYVRMGLFQPEATFSDVRNATRVTRQYEGIFPPVLYVDASVTRDIDTIRNLVRNFMRTKAPGGLVKFVIFDEADRLGYDAQGALRVLLEKYPNTRTVYTTNELHKIDPAIRSRAAGGVLAFKYPPVEQVTTYLKNIAEKEGMAISDEKLREIAAESESVREAVGALGTEIALEKAEKMPAIPPRPPPPAGLEEFIPEEEPIPEEPGPQDVDVAVIVDTYFKKENGKWKKPGPHEPHYFVTFSLPDKLATPPWSEETWTFTGFGIHDTKELKKFLAEGEQDYDHADNLRMSFGQEWEGIRSVLEENPPPFNKFTTFTLHWTREHVYWSPQAEQIRDVYEYNYSPEELRGMSREELDLVAAVKRVAKGKTKSELIDNILASQAYEFPADLIRDVIRELEMIYDLERIREWKVHKPADWATLNAYWDQVPEEDRERIKALMEKHLRAKPGAFRAFLQMVKARGQVADKLGIPWREAPSLEEVARGALEDLEAVGMEALAELEEL
ncbi:MAG: AAA family ATPase [Candidatus Bathyarchaeia archaeon]